MTESHQALAALGWDERWERGFSEFLGRGWLPARVAVEDKHHYQLFAEQGILTGKITGRFRAQTKAAADFPKVGDWVAYTPLEGENRAQIHAVVRRRTQLARKRKGRETSEQVLVANVDTAFVVHGLDRELNVRLIERFLVMTREGGVQPVVLLNKADLDVQANQKAAALRTVVGEVPVQVTCARTGNGLAELAALLQPGKSLVFMGTSGVGKSSLINQLYGEEIQATADVRERDSKGRHTTSWREMIVLPKGGIVIDTPGMREFHMWMSGEGIHEAFPEIEALASRCHFRDCTHTREKKCAVISAVESGALSRERYENFLKLGREIDFLHRTNLHRQLHLTKRGSAARKRAVEADYLKKPIDQD